MAADPRPGFMSAREQSFMTDSEFINSLADLVWEGATREPSHRETLERVQVLIEQHGLLLAALKDVGEAYLTSAGWAEGAPELATALLWGLQVLQDCKELKLSSR